MRGWLLLKGMRQDARHWRDLPARLAERTGARVIALDPPGVGQRTDVAAPVTVSAMVDDLRARFLAERGEDGPWGLVGLSLGGMVALDWASRAPEDLGFVLVGNTSARDVAAPWQRLRVDALAATVVRALDPTRRERAVVDLITRQLGVAERERVAAENARWQSERPATLTTLLAQVRAGASFTAPTRVSVPVGVLVGTGDRLVDPACGRALAARLGVTPVELEGAGHDLSLDAPDALLDAICAADQVLQSIAPSGKK